MNGNRGTQQEFSFQWKFQKKLYHFNANSQLGVWCKKLIRLEFRSRTKNPTSTPSVVRNLTPTPPKNLRPLATRHRLLNPAFNCCAQPANNHSCNSSQVCAPVFAHLTPATRTSDAYYDPTGICYMLQDFNKPKKNVYRYQPCINSLGTSLNAHYGSSHSYCQAGFGAAFTKVGWNDMVWILFMILKRYLCLFLAWKQAMLVSFKNYVPQHFCR